VIGFEHYLDQLEREGRLLRDSAGRPALRAAVPSCPGWDVARLLGHVTKVHHWAASILRGGRPDEFEFSVPEAGELFEVYDAGLAEVLSQLRATPETAVVWTMTPAPSGRLFWARRLAHETAIHGIDELLTGSAARFDRGGLPGDKVISLTPLDSNASWTLRIGPDLLSCESGAVDDADLSVFGVASDLYRWVWNRGGEGDVALRGDLTLADRWRRDFTVRARR